MFINLLSNSSLALTIYNYFCQSVILIIEKIKPFKYLKLIYIIIIKIDSRIIHLKYLNIKLVNKFTSTIGYYYLMKNNPESLHLGKLKMFQKAWFGFIRIFPCSVLTYYEVIDINKAITLIPVIPFYFV